MENENNKIGFFSRIKIAVAKLENYGMFLGEKTSVAVKYFFLIVLILATVMALVETYSMMKMVNKGYQYVKNEMPDFSYSDGNLTFSENTQGYDEEFDIYMIADTADSVSDEAIQQYRDTIKSTGIIFLKDKMIYKVGADEAQYKYTDLASQYGVNSLDKAALIEKIDSIGIMGIAFTIFVILVIGLYFVELISVFMDWILLTIFAFFSAKICRLNMNFKQAFNISIYALTLSIILSMLYNIAYYLFGFYTEYFRTVYFLISYVYIVAVILMIKSDLLKQQIEVSKIIEVQKEIHEELENQEEKNDESKENKSPEKNDDNNEKNSDGDASAGEADGSEI